MTGFVYGLIDPRTLLIRYVGCAIKASRPLQHDACLREDWSGEATYKTNWIRELRQAGFSHTICVLETCSAEELFQAERWWIAFIGRVDNGTGVLTNATDGGEGNLNPSAETRAKIGAAASIREVSLKTREKMSASHQGMVFSDEHRASLSVAAIGNTNGVRGFLGHTHSPESRDKIGIASFGRAHSAETRAKMSASHRKRLGRG